MNPKIRFFPVFWSIRNNDLSKYSLSAPHLTEGDDDSSEEKEFTNGKEDENSEEDDDDDDMDDEVEDMNVDDLASESDESED